MATKTNTEINGKKYYRITRTIGHKTVDGKRVPIKKQFLGRSKGEAEQKYIEWNREQERARYEKQHDLDITTFGERAEQYVETVLKVTQKYTNGTRTRYESAYNAHVKGSPLCDQIAWQLTAAEIQAFYNSLDVSSQTMRQVHKFMSALYKWMVLNDYATNVLAAVELPVKQDNSRHNDIVVWDPEEIDAILSHISGHRLCFLVHVLLYTGMRVGEALGLKYGDIEDGTIHVRRQCYLGEIKAPKFNSARDIPMHEDLKRELAIHREWHINEMVRNGYRTDYIFTTKSGNLLETGNLRRSLTRFYDRIDVPHKHNHAYRSTFCTQLCRCGVQLEVASKLLGHKSLDVTARHYALVKPETKQEAIDMLHY